MWLKAPTPKIKSCNIGKNHAVGPNRGKVAVNYHCSFFFLNILRPQFKGEKDSLLINLMKTFCCSYFFSFLVAWINASYIITNLSPSTKLQAFCQQETLWSSYIEVIYLHFLVSMASVEVLLKLLWHLGFIIFLITIHTTWVFKVLNENGLYVITGNNFQCLRSLFFFTINLYNLVSEPSVAS